MIGYRIEISARVSYFAGKEEFVGWNIAAEQENSPAEIMATVNTALRRLQDQIRALVTVEAIGRIEDADPEQLSDSLAAYDVARKAVDQ